MNGQESDFSEDKLQSNLEQAHLICVRLEMLKGIDSPAQDQGLRLSLQVDRLNQEWTRKHQPAPSKADQTRQLIIDWCCLGPVPESALNSLYPRFLAAVEKQSNT